MNEDDEAWQRRVRDLYDNIEDLYEHVDVTIVIFDHALEYTSDQLARGSADPGTSD